MIKKLLAKSKLICKVYKKYKERNNFKTKYKFIDRRTGKKSLCYILAGYKEFLWDEVFGRVKKYIPSSIDVCILSSGIYSDKLNRIAEVNGWSYLSTKRNNVCVAQNVLFRMCDNIDFYYKLDEDIFVTENYFEKLKDCYDKVCEDGMYVPGIVCPMIPINGFSYVEVLKRFNAVDAYEKMFGKVKYCAGPEQQIECNPSVAKFMWGENGYLPSIDSMNKTLNNDEFSYTVCPIRFSIGAIMFASDTIKKIGGFTASKIGNDLGIDEVQILSLAYNYSLTTIVSKNTLVGHLSFGKQNATMKEYYENNKDLMFKS